MNIGVDIRSLMDSNRTGVGEYTYELLNALFKIDKENQYFLFYNSNKDVSQNIPKWKQENVNYIGFSWPNKLLNIFLLFFKFPRIDKIINKKLDYFFSPNINFLSLSKDVKHILTIHDLSFEYFPDCLSRKRRLWHKILNPKKACEKADIIITPSENTKRDVIDRYGISGEKIKKIYPGLSSVFGEENNFGDEEIRNKYKLPKNFILFLGTIEPRKNIIGSIEAFIDIYSNLPDYYQLVIAGSKGWEFEPIINLIDKHDRIKYIGYVNAQEKSKLYGLADLFIYPSLYEGFGFPVLEAMFSGTPVLTSNRSSLPEIVGDCAYMVNPNNIDEIARGIELVLKDKGLSKFFAEKGRQRSDYFTWSKAAREFIEILK